MFNCYILCKWTYIFAYFKNWLIESSDSFTKVQNGLGFKKKKLFCGECEMNHQRCKVCEEPAAGFHFGAFTCEGCKVR
ncbi:estrogen receptor-like [Aphis craccivora]|uniref:Estrogen receptor-like n=1 Tax=Aphis craccivora TaxID=307492 RepID=A0A6G0ZAW0_APHCR|nr:estrogen receptor-like [Aphis craccivora]